MFQNKKMALTGVALLGGLLLSPAYAATFNVTKTADSNDGICDTDCSLREAVIAANNQPGADVVVLPTGNYQLTLAGANEDNSATGDLDVKEDLTINGAGKDLTTIDGMALDRILSVYQQDSTAISLSVRDVTIRNGKANGAAGIYFYGTGNLTVENSLLTKHHSLSYGGAIEMRGIWLDGVYSMPVLNVADSIITENCATSAPAIDGEGTWTISKTTISNNGGDFTPDQGTPFYCDVNAFGGGGAMYLQAATVTIRDSSITGNESQGGGAIHAWCCEVDIINSTIADNTAVAVAGYGGGAIEVYGANIRVKNSSIVNNRSLHTEGGGIRVIGGNTWWSYNNSVSLENSIVANNSAPLGPDCVGVVTSLGHNLIGDLSGCNYAAAAGELTGDPGLESFVDDGSAGSGYFPLLSTSQALDAGNNAGCTTTDQRGISRPQDGDDDGVAACDIGAYEKAPLVLADVCPVGCPFRSIQAAIDAAASGDTISVGSGVYLENLNIGKQVMVVSTSGAENTTIQGIGGTVVTIGASATLDGFIVTGGNATNGGGIYISGISSILNNIIRGNSATNGAGIYAYASADIVGNVIEDNNASTTGGGIIIARSYTTVNVRENVIRRNNAKYSGGLFTSNYLLAVVEDNLFEANAASTSSYGSAMNIPAYTTLRMNRNVYKDHPGIAVRGSGYAGHVIKNTLFVGNDHAILLPSYSRIKVVNSTITGNTLGVTGGSYCQGSCPQVINSVVWGNGTDVRGWGLTVTHSVLGMPRNGAGNIVADPLFVDAAGGDYRVQSGSPAIDSGIDTSADGVIADIDNVTRPQDGDGQGAGGAGDGSDYDKGAYEFAN